MFYDSILWHTTLTQNLKCFICYITHLTLNKCLELPEYIFRKLFLSTQINVIKRKLTPIWNSPNKKLNISWDMCFIVRCSLTLLYLNDLGLIWKLGNHFEVYTIIKIFSKDIFNIVKFIGKNKINVCLWLHFIGVLQQ